MLTLLKGISVKVYLAIILVLGVAGWLSFKAYTGSLVEKGAAQVEQVTLEQNLDHAEQSAAITDKVVSGFVNDTKKSHETTEKNRKEALNEYVNKIEPKPVKKPVESSAVPDGADRVGILYERMHDNYCRARPEDARCDPVNANK